MNNGKICISVCAETADELIEQIKRAEDLADVIEIRFDCLKESEFEVSNHIESEKSFNKILGNKTYKDQIILTFRPREQGGMRNLSLQEREDFWNSGYDSWGGDFEEDVVENHVYWLYGPPIICSYHDFSGVPENLTEIYKRIISHPNANIDVVKIAVQSNDITDTIPIWKLLERAKSENKEIIPIAMGESGKWTRILGLAHGAFMTYAALDSGKETAPGQVSAKDLIEVYRAKELNENTDIYGIIAGNTTYSMSPYIHNAAFKFHKLNSVFVPLQVQNLDEFMRRMVLPKTREIELNFKGFSVTNPHKQSIIKYLDELDETAEKIGAVNTVKIENGKLYGFNTDAKGFIEPLKNAYGNLSGTKVAVFGAGGAARACIYALKQENADVTIFARNPKKAENLAKEFEVELEKSPKIKDQKSKINYDILVNTTPLGTKGEFENETPVNVEDFKNIHFVYDLVYNPFETRFLREAKNSDIPTIGGSAMLIAQAMTQSKIWTNLDAPMKEMSRAALQKLQK